MNNAQIPLIDFTIFDFLIQNAKRFCILCGDDNAAGVTVDAIAERRGKGVLFSGPPLSFGIEIRLNVIDQRFSVFCTVMRMNSLSRLFVYQKNILVFIDDV